MNVDLLREIHLRLCILIQQGGSQEAIKSQLDSLGKAIEELADRTQTYAKLEFIHAKFDWAQMDERMGYHERPWRRSDDVMVVRLNEKPVYWGFLSGEEAVKDSLKRMRHWRSAQSAMAHIDTDYPVGGDWRKA